VESPFDPDTPEYRRRTAAVPAKPTTRASGLGRCGHEAGPGGRLP
jgi:hypothetical protein